MCGICGALGFEKASLLVHRMNRALIHRGPDSEGYVEDGKVVLGVRRLRIIDLAQGDQPIYNEDRSMAIVFNGEVYNYRQLRQQLKADGHAFKTCTDTEVVLHAYEQWGVNCLKQLRGVFAFAIWQSLPGEARRSDDREMSVLLVRDRLGVKPLYLWLQQDRVLFASEVRSLLASELIPKQISRAGLYTYLLFGSVQEPLTLVDGITSLRPASWLRVDFSGADQRIVRTTAGTYWEPPQPCASSPTPSDVRSRLLDAVQARLVSDVSLGSFLSGGLDSGAVVALGSEAQIQPMRTFTLAFDDWPYDERDLALATAESSQADHQVRVISQADVIADLPRAMEAMDQPTVDGINTWYVSREARRSGLKVSLSGVGGDEIFAGYPSFRYVPYLSRLRVMARYLPTPLKSERVLKLLLTDVDRRRKLGDFLRGDAPFDHPYFAIRGLFAPSSVERLLQFRTARKLTQSDLAVRNWTKCVQEQIGIASKYDGVGEVSWLEISQYLRSTLLRDTDMMSMAHSLEVRVPLVDHLLIEFILPAAGGLKFDGVRQKPLLRSAVGEMLPDRVLASPKHTFTFPFQQWLLQDLADEVGECLGGLSSVSRRWLNPSTVEDVWIDFLRGLSSWSRPWALYALDVWIRNNF